MTKEESLKLFQDEYSYYQNELDKKNNKLNWFYNFIPDAYIMVKLRTVNAKSQKIVNTVKKGTTRIFWPVIGHFNSYPACSYYDASNQLLDIQEEVVLEYKECLDKLVEIVNEDNVSVIYPLMRTTLSCFYGQFALIDRASLKMKDTMTGKDVEPIDYTRFNLDVFMDFFESTISGIESLNNHNKMYQK